MFRVRVKDTYSRRRPRKRLVLTLHEDMPIKQSKSTLDREYSRNLACAVNWTGAKRNHNNPPYVCGNIIYNN